MKLKRKILIPAIAISLAVLVGAGVLTYRAIYPPYNMHPDLSRKVVGSISIIGTRIEPTEMETLVDYADLIVIGTALDDGTLSWFDTTGGSEGLKEKYGEENTKGQATLTKFRIDQLIAGEAPESKMIQIFQLGAPGTLEWQTKLKKGDKVYIMLRDYLLEDSIYLTADGENSVFYIEKSNKLTSMSALMLCARYDGLPVSRLTTDVKKTKKYREVLGKKTGWVKNGTPVPASSTVSGKPAQSKAASSAPASSAVSSKPAASSGVATSSKVSSGAQ